MKIEVSPKAAILMVVIVAAVLFLGIWFGRMQGHGWDVTVKENGGMMSTAKTVGIGGSEPPPGSGAPSRETLEPNGVHPNLAQPNMPRGSYGSSGQ